MLFFDYLLMLSFDIGLEFSNWIFLSKSTEIVYNKGY